MGKLRVEDLRINYNINKLDDVDAPPNPIILFNKWLESAADTSNNSLFNRFIYFLKMKLFGVILEANAMVLSTVDINGNPNSRTVLLKGITEDGLEFFTNYNSTKSKEIENNSNVSCTFWWPPLQRQVIVRGVATKLSDVRNDEYFNVRPRSNKIGAWASNQSYPINSREDLEREYKLYEDKFKNISTDDIKRPPNWGGFYISINTIEFWQGRIGRLHDRIRYTKLNNGSWEWTRINP